jgi:hypothetical protein
MFSLFSFNIENMYINMLKSQVVDIIENNPELTKTNQTEIINILNAAIEQSYFQFNQQYYK